VSKIKLRPQKISKDIFNFPSQKQLPEIVELNREDSDAILPLPGQDDQGYKLGQATLLGELSPNLDAFVLEETLADDGDNQDDLLRMAKGSWLPDSGVKIYSMNRDGNYSTTTGLSRKNSVKPGSFRVSNEEIEAKVASLENDDFNPKMFKYSLPGD
jgi:hypothetical protein